MSFHNLNNKLIKLNEHINFLNKNPDSNNTNSNTDLNSNNNNSANNQFYSFVEKDLQYYITLSNYLLEAKDVEIINMKSLTILKKLITNIDVSIIDNLTILAIIRII